MTEQPDEQIPETFEDEVEEPQDGSPYDELEVVDGVGYHDNEAEVLDTFPPDYQDGDEIDG